MPIYEYQCQSCERVIESIHGMSEPGPTTCGSCGGKLSKLVSASSFHLKGTGWYKTDYASSSSSAASAGGKKKGDEKKSDEGSESKSESKPEKAEPKAESKKDD